jgi:hypothetical protein
MDCNIFKVGKKVACYIGNTTLMTLKIQAGRSLRFCSLQPHCPAENQFSVPISVNKYHSMNCILDDSACKSQWHKQLNSVLLESLKQNENILLVLLAKLNLRPYLITTIIQKQKKFSSNCTVNDRHTVTTYNSYSNRNNLLCFYPTWSISHNFTQYWYIRFTVISIYGDL